MLCLLVLLAASCTGTRRGPDKNSRAQTGATTPGRFPHETPAHVALACTKCHSAEYSGSSTDPEKPKRPGADEHSPCDQAGCHRDVFFARPGRFCLLCHRSLSAWQPGGMELAPYPPQLGPRALVAEFSHRMHLDKTMMDRRMGFHPACNDCHRPVGDDKDMALPKHTDCVRCHNAKSTGARPSIDSCRSCHDGRAPSPPHDRSTLGKVRFRHGTHEVDRSGRSIQCVSCHRDIARTSSAPVKSLPSLAVCVECHEDKSRTPADARMTRCEVNGSPYDKFDAEKEWVELTALEKPTEIVAFFR
ncbi:MAG: hypothetical protein V2A73_04400 [Pseudomonadota bacterium]